MPVTGSQVAAHYRAQADTLHGLIQSHEALLGELQAIDTGLAGELAAAKRELAAVYLPELSDVGFARAEKLTGFQGLSRRDPRIALAQERKVLQATQGKLEADERFGRRDVLVGPSGTLTQELDASKEALAPLQAECDRFEQQGGFLELIEIGYDTPAFQERWWNASYWRHWSAGDRICKELGLADFGDDVIPAYRRYAEPRDVMAGDVERLFKLITAVHDLVQERDRVVDRLAHLDELYLGQAQDFLGEHLEHADLALLEKWAEAEPELLRPLQVAPRKLAGLQAKRSFVGEMVQQGVPPMVTKLYEQTSKARQKAAKFSRQKNQYATFHDSFINHDFAAKAAAMQAQRDKLRRRVDELVAARNYQGFTLTNDRELWWMYLMSSPPPRYMPGLYGYYAQRPNITVLTDPDYVDLDPSPGEAAAAAFAAGDLERGSYLS